MTDWFYKDYLDNRPLWWRLMDAVPFIRRCRRLAWYAKQSEQMKDRATFFVGLWLEHQPYLVDMSDYPWYDHARRAFVNQDQRMWVRAFPELAHGSAAGGCLNMFKSYPGRGWVLPEVKA